jgi:hypothetical protein
VKNFILSLKIFLYAILTVLVLSLGTLTWALYHPQQTYKIAEKYFFPEDLKITWKKWDFKIENLGKWNFSFDLRAEDFQIEKNKPFLRIPIQYAHLNAEVWPLKRQIRFNQLEMLAPGKIEFQSAESKNSIETNIFQKIQSIFGLVNSVRTYVEFNSMNLQLSQILISKERKEPLSISIDVESKDKNPSLEFTGKVEQVGNGPFRASFDGSLNPLLIKTSDNFLSTKIDFRGFGLNTSAFISATSQEDIAILKIKGQTSYTKEKLKLSGNPEIEIKFQPSQAELTLNSAVSGIPGIIKNIKNLKINLETPFDQNVFISEKPSLVKMEIPIVLSFVDLKLLNTLQKNCNCRFPFSLLGKVEGKIWFARLLDPSAKKLTLMDLEVNLESLKNKLFALDLASTIQIEKESSRWFFLPVLNCRADIYSFQGLSPLFKEYKIMIPAPFDVLDGTLNFVASGSVIQNNSGSHFPASLDLNLSSKRQSIRIHNKATFSFSSDFKKLLVETYSYIKDLQLELPPLNPIGGKPRILVDKRILRKPPPQSLKKSNFEVNFIVQAETTGPGQIRLLSQYFKPYLPLSIKLQFNSKKGSDGFIKIEPFDIVYLRRTVRVEKLNLDISRIDEDIIPVDGRFKIQQTNYTVFISVQGNAKSPQITMRSEPELPQSEIVSVLLYDRRSDELTSGDAETSGGVQAAVADRAIGLFGLWAFASTPIRSFYYNPVTKVYTATLDLGNGISAGIDTTWESTARLELRKRVSKQWMLTARWNADTPDKDQNSEVVLQWEKRF